MPCVLKVENISKMYRLGEVSTGALAHDINRWWHKIRGKEDPYQKVAQTNIRDSKGSSDYVWALKDISFEVQQGEVLGIIGRNGAGKSTLLKILSRITSPTSGSVRIKGRIASLLEVGTGFHPELTGRENIYLNGAILGMTKAEINQKFDEIVDFSGVERYIDTPVKRYSSGMYVRLAFAVAVHLESEILIIDEVLAVGDAEFQKKCLGKMKDVSSKEGRTVLFVSHNMAAVQNLCNKGILLNYGKLSFPLSKINEVINFYLKERREQSHILIPDRKDRLGEGKVRIINFRITDNLDHDLQTIITGQEVLFKIYYEAILSTDKVELSLNAALSLYSADGFLLTVLSSELTEGFIKTNKKKGCLECKIAKFPLTQGDYVINLIIRERNIIQDWIQEAFFISVEDGDFFGTGRTVPSSHRSVLIEQKWLLIS